MRKLFLALAAVAALAVAGPAGAATKTINIYGTQATLSGVISTHETGQPVTIYYQPYPQPNLIQRATVLTAPGGVFSFIIEPQILTSYEAAWKGAFATPTTV